MLRKKVRTMVPGVPGMVPGRSVMVIVRVRLTEYCVGVFWSRARTTRVTGVLAVTCGTLTTVSEPVRELMAKYPAELPETISYTGPSKRSGSVALSSTTWTPGVVPS